MKNIYFNFNYIRYSYLLTYSVIILIVLIYFIPINIYADTQAYISDRQVDVLDADIYNDELLYLKVDIAGKGLSDCQFNYNKNYKVEGLYLIGADIKYNSSDYKKIEDKIDNYSITFRFIPDPEFIGDIELLPLEIWFYEKTNPDNIVATSTNRNSIHISSAFVRDAILLIILFIVIGFIIFIVIYFLIRFYNSYKEKKKKHVEKDKTALSEVFYLKYQQMKFKAVKKDLNSVVEVIRKLTTAYILQKLQVSRLENFFQLENIDENVKEEIKRFYRHVNRISFSKERVTKEELDVIEDNFKTLLFVI